VSANITYQEFLGGISKLEKETEKSVNYYLFLDSLKEFVLECMHSNNHKHEDNMESFDLELLKKTLKI